MRGKFVIVRIPASAGMTLFLVIAERGKFMQAHMAESSGASIQPAYSHEQTGSHSPLFVFHLFYF